MKKIIIILLLIPSICFSEIKGFIEYGQDVLSDIAYTEMQIGYNFNVFMFKLYPYANINTWMEMNKQSGSPFRDIYTFGSDIIYNDIKINFSHFCSHYVYSNRKQYHRYNDIPLGGNLTKISIRYSF